MASLDKYIWAQDFTYVPTRKGMLYVAMILRPSTREIVGWSVGANHTAELTKAALLDALSRHLPPDILHSDRGSEYLSFAMERTCAAANIHMSVSSSSRPWQNGFCDRIWGHFIEEVASRIYYYNNLRIHTKLKMPPAVYAAKHGFKQIELVSEIKVA